MRGSRDSSGGGADVGGDINEEINAVRSVHGDDGTDTIVSDMSLNRIQILVMLGAGCE